ncbi:MAG TPA: hypothetical protein DEB39_03330 [Planctomycetaceae bacterium]|nr:hypothetical protein [Planctomycetaceae bacterium]
MRATVRRRCHASLFSFLIDIFSNDSLIPRGSDPQGEKCDLSFGLTWFPLVEKRPFSLFVRSVAGGFADGAAPGQ